MATGNPAKKAAEKKIATAEDFRNRNRATLEMPSGLVVKLRNPGGLRAFIGGGTIPNSLLPMIEGALNKGTAPDVKQLMKKNGKIDPDMVIDMVEMMDRIAVACMVEPRLLPVPTQADLAEYNARNPENQLEPVNIDLIRDERYLYADELPDDDKQFIFSWISSGVTDLETFRQQTESGLDAVAAIAGASDDAELPAGTKTR